MLELKVRQSAKIREISEALVTEGVIGLDAQAVVLGLSRSTTWTIVRGVHKSSGLSARVINRMLAAPLPHGTRTKLLEYIGQKSAGHYGGSKSQLRKFESRLGPRSPISR
jgi:hypothetical protein